MTAWVESIFGQAGILTLAALVGASDIDPFVLNLAQGGAPDMGITALAAAVLIAASANNLAKAGIEGQRSGSIPASALARASSERSCSALRSITSAGRHKSPLGSSASAPVGSLA